MKFPLNLLRAPHLNPDAALAENCRRLSAIKGETWVAATINRGLDELCESDDTHDRMNAECCVGGRQRGTSFSRLIALESGIGELTGEEMDRFLNMPFPDKTNAAKTISKQSAPTLETLRAQLDTEKDPARKSELARQCRVLRGHADLWDS